MDEARFEYAQTDLEAARSLYDEFTRNTKVEESIRILTLLEGALAGAIIANYDSDSDEEFAEDSGLTLVDAMGDDQFQQVLNEDQRAEVACIQLRLITAQSGMEDFYAMRADCEDAVDTALFNLVAEWLQGLLTSVSEFIEDTGAM